MKALSLKQPFAELILQGKKKIELRKWNTNFRGKIFIHASKSPDKKNMKRLGFKNLLCGFIVGKANLVEVKKYNSDKEFLADKSWGNYGFILRDIKRIKPIATKGKLNFWEFQGKVKRRKLKGGLS